MTSLTIILTIIKPIIVLLFAVFLIVTSLVSGKKAETFMSAAREYNFKFVFLIPAGLFLTNNLVLKFYNPGKNLRLRNIISNLYGVSAAEHFLKLHTIQKIALVLAVLFFSALISLTVDVDFLFIFFAVTLAVLASIWADRNLDFKLKDRNQTILIELPEFINKVALLVNAGLTFNASVNRIVTEKDEPGPLYKELYFVISEINNGKEIKKSYEDFALRCRIPEITRFVSAVLQNINRGSNDFVSALRLMAQEAWEKRKDIAKKQGEEASSKLVFPMVMIFVAVAIIVLAPAMMTMGM